MTCLRPDSMSPFALALVAVGVASFGAVGCTPEAELEAQPNVVRATWNPTTGELPSPTDLVRNSETDRLDVPVADDAPAAEREFTQYLNSLDGFPLASTLEVPLSGDVVEPALAGTFFAFDTQTRQSLDLELAFDPELDLVTATPTTAALLPGRTYVFGLRGYDGGLVGASGQPVIADAGFYLVRSISPLDEHPAAMPGDSRDEKIATADKLRRVQQAYAPLIELTTEMRGFARDELAVLSSFTTTRKPAIWFDPNTGRIPIPNQLLIDPATGLVDLPVADDDGEEVRDIKATLSKYDGFAASAAIVFESTHPIDPATVASEDGIRLFEKNDDGSFTEVTALERGVLDDGKTFWIRPELTLEANTDYVVVATQHLAGLGGQAGGQTGAQRLRAQPLGALLRSKARLVDGATSQVSAIDDATAQMLEPVREKAEPVLDMLAQSTGQSIGQPVSRDLVSAAVPFRTVSAIERLMARRAKLYEQDVRTDIVDVEVASPLERGLWLAMPQVKTIATGEMYVLDHLDPRTRRAFEDGSAEERKASFVLTIPTGVDKGEPLPVVLFGHGLMTSRELVYLIANKLAAAGYASFALDLPYHGNRAVCVKDGDCQGSATCDDVGQCIEPDGSAGELETFEVSFVDAEYPVSTGFSFVEIGNLVGTRDHFAQAALDLMQGLRVLRGADWVAQTGGYKVDGDDVVYLGMSLGGIVGAILSAAEPTLETLVLNVPGADYFKLIENSPTFRTDFQNALDHRGVEQGSDAYFEFGNTIRWLLDPVDPLNLVQHTIDDPVTYIDPVDGQEKTAPPKRVLIQMAKNDAVVPNVATHALSERMGVPISEYEPAISNHGFLFDPTSFEGRDARNEMVEFFDAR